MNELAKGLNEVLDTSIAGAFLSQVGRRMYFPKGIVAQSDEAKQKADRYNATVGLATSKGQPMHLVDIMDFYKEGVFKPSDIFNYAPGGGDKTLRAIWKEEILRKNPSLRGTLFSQPLVTAGLTHAISLCATLFFDEGDTLVLPDLFWDNYDLIFTDLVDAKMIPFTFFKDGGFNTEGLKEALLSAEKDSVRLILNFPNNPTGYTPTHEEALSIVEALKEVAKKKKVLVIVDDAYYGLFYEKETEKESLFTYLCDLDENIFAIKGDAATKEEMVWGFRIGFITYGANGLSDEAYQALTNKTLGAIRCTVSNCDRPGQSLLLDAMKNGKHYEEDKEKLFSEMNLRYDILKKELENYKDRSLLRPYPFNSGYFMSFDTTGHSAEELRCYLLEKYGVGAINIFDRTFRVAYCSVEPEKIKDLVALIYKAAEELWS